jgi:hypothetical protein
MTPHTDKTKITAVSFKALLSAAKVMVLAKLKP